MATDNENDNTTKLMKAALASRFGQPDDVLTVEDNVPLPPRPALDKKNTCSYLLLRVYACSLSPGDYRGLLGQKPIVAPSIGNHKWPYIPGGDVAGDIVEIHKNAKEEKDETSIFAVGDRVVATWDMFGTGGLAEYIWVKTTHAVKLPSNVDYVEAAAMANSAAHAKLIVEKAGFGSNQQQQDQQQQQKQQRVLVLGGSGGVGTCVLQLLKRHPNVECIVTTTTDDKLAKELGANRVINYKTTEENWWEMSEFQQEQNKFDVIIDCAIGQEAWKKCGPVLKRRKDGGRFVAVVLHDWYIDGTSWFRIFVKFMFPLITRQMGNFFQRWSAPEYCPYMEMIDKTSLAPVVSMVSNGELQIVIDRKNGGPYPFTTQGVRDAFNQHIARKGHGKIVVKIID